MWWLEDDPGLGVEARSAIQEPDNNVLVSAASIWEISIKQATGKLTAPSDFLRYVEDSQFQALPITQVHAYAAGGLPPHHRDPFDRMLVAQATAESLTIVTRDPRISLYGVATLSA